MLRSGKLPVLNLLTGQKSGFPPCTRPAVVTSCTDSRQTWQGRRAHGSAWLCKISPQLPQGVEMQPPKYQKFPLFGIKVDSVDQFLKFLGAFMCHNYPTLVFQI